MAERYQGLHAVLMALVEHGIVKRQALLIRLGIIAVREDAAPADGHAEHLETHLAHESEVILVGVVEIDTATLGQIPVLRMLFHISNHLFGGSVMGQARIVLLRLLFAHFLCK